MIQKTPGWQYVGVYADEALTGTKENRMEFQKLLKACHAGEIDMVITKSVSRFARNTVTTLKTIRELRLIGVDVYFEKKDFYTGKVPKNAVKSAVFGNYWCLGGV